MRRFFIAILGMIIVLSIVGTIVMAFVPDVLKPLEGWLCPENTTISTESYQTRPGETSIDFVCRDVDGIIVENVSGKVMLPFFVIMFGAPILLVILRATGRRHSSDVTGQIASSDQQATSSRDLVLLSEKLQHLQTVLDLGLITQEEYEHKRQELIDTFT